MKKKTIICVDDEKIVLDSLKRELKAALADNFNIEVAESGDEALEILDELIEDNADIQLVISDFIMPGMKGDELLEKVKLRLPNTYTILLTGQATIDGVANAINKAKLYRYISKPWDTNDLTLTIIEALKSYEKDELLELRREELELANAKLLKLDAAKSYFLGLLSHELNTPLIGINGNAKLIFEISDDVDIKESAESILESEARLRRLSELSLLITRIRTEKYQSTFYEESILDILESSLNNFSQKIEFKNLQIVKNLPQIEYLKKVDVSLIMKMFDFIIDNAIKFSPDSALLSIIGRIENKQLIIVIKDNGNGFSVDTLSNLFEYFSSTENLMAHSEGTGLSLSASKVIMELHNFDIKAYNSKDGGAEIHLFF